MTEPEPEPITEVDRDEVTQQVLTFTINVEDDDPRWMVGHVVGIRDVALFRIVAATLDPKHGKVVTLIRDNP